MNTESMVMRDLTLAVYAEQYERPATQYLADLVRVMSDQGYSLERAIVELFEVQSRSGVLDVDAPRPHMRSTRDASGMVPPRKWYVGGNGDGPGVEHGTGKTIRPLDAAELGFVSVIPLEVERG